MRSSAPTTRAASSDLITEIPSSSWTHAYPKRACVLYMLRSQLGVDLYRRCIKTYMERHRNGIVSTDDLQDVIEEISGLSFDPLFDQ